jgi:DNA topoisomerase-1
MPSQLLIVESPAKAKTIEKILGKDFAVSSCNGHIRDLPKGKLGVNTEKRYEPQYEISEDKEAVVKQLKKLAKKAKEVWLATDEDREGEAISWHLCHALGLDPKTTKRIVFHEITKPAITSAVKKPRHINIDLVNAQQARRVLDRLVGFELSPILWKKVSRVGNLSAGRVQSVAVRLIVEREQEIRAFATSSSYRVEAEFLADGSKLKAELTSRIEDHDRALGWVNKCINAEFIVDNVDVKPGTRTPAAPFTTSTLQQEASRKLGFSVARTMSTAQKLYEAGRITYMRTDSVNLSQTALDDAKKTIITEYGEAYSEPHQYKTKSASAQEAHEAIRPTYFSDKTVSGTSDQQRLYELIWKRAIASQMTDAKLKRTTISIGISTVSEKLQAKGEVIVFDGFLKVYLESRDEPEDEDSSGLLPDVQVGQKLDLQQLRATERFARPPARYTEASLVKKLEELGIGRPSTYAPTISTIQKRGYVEKADRDGVERKYNVITLTQGKVSELTDTEITGQEKAKMFPTDIGILVNEFLVTHFKKVMDYNFTAEVELHFDEIADGKVEWHGMIDEFYKPFKATVEKTLNEAERVTGERELGVDPKSGKPVIARMGRYGPMIQIGAPDDEEKPQFAKLRPNQSIQTITLEEALKLLELPRTLGDFEGEEVKVSEGRYGPYVLHNGKFYSLRKDQDPHEIPLKEAIALIEEKRDKEAKKLIKEFEAEGIKVLNGMYGPYIKSGRLNYRIPKGTDVESLTLEQCLEIIKNAPEKKPRRWTRQKR